MWILGQFPLLSILHGLVLLISVYLEAKPKNPCDPQVHLSGWVRYNKRTSWVRNQYNHPSWAWISSLALEPTHVHLFVVTGTLDKMAALSRKLPESTLPGYPKSYDESSCSLLKNMFSGLIPAFSDTPKWHLCWVYIPFYFPWSYILLKRQWIINGI